MNAIFNRRSIRKYTDREVSEDTVLELLRAAMAAPSAGNQQPWEFMIIRDRKILNEIPKYHQHAKMLKEAPVAIVVCSKTTNLKYEGFWVQDCAAATENILIEAQDKGLGAVWLGVYPKEERVKALQDLFGMPDDHIPFSIIAIGYPGEKKEPSDRFDPSRLHYDRW